MAEDILEIISHLVFAALVVAAVVALVTATVTLGAAVGAVWGGGTALVNYIKSFKNNMIDSNRSGREELSEIYG